MYIRVGATFNLTDDAAARRFYYVMCNVKNVN